MLRRDAFRGDTGTAPRGASAGYTELASGLNYRDENGTWRDSVVEPEIMGDGSVRFSKLPTIRTFAAGSGQRVVVQSQRRGGPIAKSALGGLSYYDLASGRTALIAWVTNVPVQVCNEGVYYEHAFVGVDADIVYKVHKWGMEQDVVIYGGLPDPTAFGMDPAQTRLCALTELVDFDLAEAGMSRDGAALPGEPARAPLEVRVRHSNDWALVHNWRPSYAFAEEGTWVLGGARSRAARHDVSMRVFQAAGRVFLSEEVRFSGVEEALPALLASASPAKVGPLDPKRSVCATAVLEMSDARPMALPPERPPTVALTQPEPEVGEQSALPSVYPVRGAPRYVLDYVDFSGSLAEDVTFAQGQTYFISGVLYLSGATLTIEPGAVVKVAPGYAWVEVGSTAHLDCRSDAANPAIFTSAYDTNVGEVVCTNGSPSANKGGNAISLMGGSNTVRGLSVRYMEWGLWCEGAGSHFVREVEIRDCDEGLTLSGASGTGSVVNVLFRDTPLAVNAGIRRLTVENGTFHGVSSRALDGNGSLANLTVRNSIFHGVANAFASNAVLATATFEGNASYGVSSGWLGSSVVGLSSNVFQVGPYGSNYLDQGSGAIDGGTVSADSIGLYHFTTATNAVKETNSTVDIGYHYPTDADGDGDGLADFIEDRDGDGVYTSNSVDIADWETWDTDGDGLSDGAEYLTHGTDPQDWDTDGDGQGDGQEINNGSDPLDPASYLTTIAGTISYSGGQTGPLRVVVREDVGLFVYYSFDSNDADRVSDLSGCGNAGTVFNGAQWVSNGYRGGAYHFDGTNDWIGGLNLGLVPTGTVSMWVKADVVDAWRHPFSTEYASWDDNLHFNMGPPGWFQAAGLGITSSIDMASAFTSNVWYHAVMTWTPTNFQAYLNGARSGQRGHVGTYPPGLNLIVSQLSIGNSYSTDSSRYWKGYIDEFAFYSRELTAAEVSNLYLSGVGGGIAITATVSAVGAYAVTNVPTLKAYSVTAYLDTDDDGEPDIGEAQGGYAGNPIPISGYTEGIDFTLTDPDTDGDGMPDWWETQYGLDPLSGAMTNLVAWWKLDDAGGTNVLDATANGNHGVAVNMATSAWTQGRLEGALCFDGANDYVQVQDAESLKPAQVSVAAWVRPDRTISNGNAIIVSKEKPGGAYGYNLRYTGNGLDFLICGPDSPYYFSLPYPVVLASGVWHHVAGSYNLTNHSLYLDGALVATASRSVALRHDTTGPRMGATCDATPIAHFPGLIDDARIWDRGLASNEIAGLSEPFRDADGDGYDNLTEYRERSDPTDSNSVPVRTVSGSVAYAGYVTGMIYVVAVPTSDSWSTVRSATMSGLGSFAMTNVPAFTSQWIKAFRDADGDGQWDSSDPWGAYSNNPVVLTGALADADVVLEGPDTDEDGDGMPDWWELTYGLNPFDADDGAADADGDGETNAEEYENGTDPRGEGYYESREAKILIGDSGLYRISKSAIAEALDMDEGDVSNATFSLRTMGTAVPTVRDNGDIVFYGEHYEDLYTDKNAYILKQGPSLAPDVEVVNSSTQAPVTSYQRSVRREVEKWLQQELIDDPSEDPWLWRQLVVGFTPEYSFPMTFTNAVASTSGTITVAFRGAEKNKGSHSVDISVNSNYVGSAYFSEYEYAQTTLVVSAGTWVLLTNSVTVEITGTTGDRVYLDFCAIEYASQFVLPPSQTLFTVQPGCIEIANVLTNALAIWNISDPSKPAVLDGFLHETNGGYFINFSNSASRLVACYAGAEFTPAAVSQVTSNALKSATNRTDYLMIVGDGLEAQAQVLADYRATNGLRTVVVPIEDVYDTINYGPRSGTALRRFMNLIYHVWAEPPRYVVLVGDGSMDYRDYNGTHDCQIPTEPLVVEMFNPGADRGIFGSDAGVTDCNQDQEAEFCVGRIPVNDTDDLATYVSNVVTYESGGMWKTNSLIATGSNVAGDGFTNRYYYGQGTAVQVAISNYVHVLKADNDDIGDLTLTNIVTAIDQGIATLVYIGHSLPHLVANESFKMSLADIEYRPDYGRPLVFLSGGCHGGTYYRPGLRDFSETLLIQPGIGACAVGSGSDVSGPFAGSWMLAMCSDIYSNRTERLGDAVQDGLQGLPSMMLRAIQILGDPALRMWPAEE